MTTDDVADRPPGICSVRRTVQLALPNMSGPGVKVRLPVTALIAGGTEKSPTVAEEQLRVNASGSVSPGPGEMPVAQMALYAPESSATVTVALVRLKLGGSFTARQKSQHKAVRADMGEHGIKSLIATNPTLLAVAAPSFFQR